MASYKRDTDFYQDPFFIRNSQLFHEINVSDSYTKVMEEQ
ncbi:hypothetical protein DSOL_3872 [Desulfosporosinus metallidurans]|uniref:Uncharacterized protein n=1 Tax=Desulfosporosinus metallidurans TaxID=1888891 RepID=A0A1Q8QN88_9FIRM|nr:hypothetical protein DSOL_3872 [Desulfosporosinus metallidurans]